MKEQLISNKTSKLANHFKDDFDQRREQTQSMLLKWLREEYDIIISIVPQTFNGYADWGQDTSKADLIITKDLRYHSYDRHYEYYIWIKGKFILSRQKGDIYEDTLEIALQHALKLSRKLRVKS